MKKPLDELRFILKMFLLSAAVGALSGLIGKFLVHFFRHAGG